MRSEPAYYPLIRVAIGLACGLLGLAATALVGLALDVPIRAVSDYAASYGAAGSFSALALLTLGVVTFNRWAQRRGERQQIAETGLLEHRHRPLSPDGTARNVLILVAPLALFVLIVAGFWLTGTPLPLPRVSGP